MSEIAKAMILKINVKKHSKIKYINTDTPAANSLKNTKLANYVHK